MNGFVDMHTHILPGVDDGAKNLDEAMELVRMAFQNGTRTMFLTPHYRGKFKRNTPDFLRETFQSFCLQVEQEFPDMKLYLGNEVYFENEAPEKLLDGEILPMCDSRYALLEFRGASLRSQIVTGVYETVQHGFTPIIAHIERYDVFCKDPTLVDEVLELGALLQLNADSVLGGNGFWVKRFCHKVLKEQKVHFIASDAHDAAKRPPLLRECFLKVHKKYGGEYAHSLFYENAQAVIENQSV